MTLDKFIGIPFVNRGRDFNGCDCYGLLMLYYKEVLGINVPDTQITAMQPMRTMAMYLEYVKANWELIDNPEINCGIALSLNENHPKLVTHFAVMISETKALHTLNKLESHIIDINSPTFKPFIRGFYRWKN